MELLTEYIQYLVMIVGVIEFIKNAVKNKGITLYCFIQNFICLIASASFVVGKEGMINNVWYVIVVNVLYYWLFFLSLSTLCYDLIIKKVKVQ